MMVTRRSVLALALMSCLPRLGAAVPRDAQLGSPQRPLSVLILPVDGGTQDGTLADYQPTLDAISKTTGLHFNVRVGQSYSAVVEAIATGLIDVAQLGVVSFQQARSRGNARFLAMQVIEGNSYYHAAVFVRRPGAIERLSDLRGRTVAFGDPSSASSFTYPLAMLMKAGVDPIRDLGRVILAGSHANALRALSEGRVDAAAASLISYQRAIERGVISADQLRPLARSVPIPNPFFAVRSHLPDAMFDTLRTGFAGAHTAPGIRPGMLRGYGGNVVTRWDTEVPAAVLDEAAAAVRDITPALTSAVISKATGRP